MVSIRNYEGNMENALREIVSSADFILEGGAGHDTTPLVWLRERGYTGPYVRMDNENYPVQLTEGEYGSQNIRGDFLDFRIARELIDRFRSKHPAFLTKLALEPAIVRSNHLNYGGSIETIPATVESAVKTFSVYNVQLHMAPALFEFASDEYVRKSGKDPKSWSELCDNLRILDTGIFDVDVGKLLLYRTFKEFLETSEDHGWKIFLLTDQSDVLFMKKS